MQTYLQRPELFKTVEIGRGSWMSVKDVQKLKSMYGCPGECHLLLIHDYPTFGTVYLVKWGTTFRGIMNFLKSVHF